MNMDFFVKRCNKTYHIFNQKQASEFSKSEVDLLSHLLGVHLQVVSWDLDRHSGQLQEIIIMKNLINNSSAWSTPPGYQWGSQQA